MKDKIVEILIELQDKLQACDESPEAAEEIALTATAIANLYSAGEEVVEFDCPECGEKLKYGFSPETLKKIRQSRLFTRPTVSEEEIESIILSKIEYKERKIYSLNTTESAKAIKELLNR